MVVRKHFHAAGHFSTLRKRKGHHAAPGFVCVMFNVGSYLQHTESEKKNRRKKKKGNRAFFPLRAVGGLLSRKPSLIDPQMRLAAALHRSFINFELLLSRRLWLSGDAVYRLVRMASHSGIRRHLWRQQTEHEGGVGVNACS